MKIIIIFALFLALLGLFSRKYVSCFPSSNHSEQQIDKSPPETMTVLHKAFDSFDWDKNGSIPTDMVADNLRLMGQPFNKKILNELIDEVADKSDGQLEFEEFVTLVGKLVTGTLKEQELQEAFRL